MQSSPLEHARRAVCNYTARGAAESSNGLRPADKLFLNKSQGVHPIVMQLQPSAWWTWQVHTLRTGTRLKGNGCCSWRQHLHGHAVHKCSVCGRQGTPAAWH